MVPSGRTPRLRRRSAGANERGVLAVQRVEWLRLRFAENLPIRAVAEAWAIDAAKLHHAYALARQEFRAALLEVVAFPQNGTSAKLEMEAASRLKTLSWFFLFFDFFRARIATALVVRKQLHVDTELRAMNEPHDPDETVEVSSAPADSIDAGLAAGFGRRADGPCSVLSALGTTLGLLRPVLLKEAQGESAPVVKPVSDAMPATGQTGSRYQLSGEIARGGMGAVLRARDGDLRRDVAVKLMLEKYVDAPKWPGGSSRKPRSAASCSIRTSCRSTNSAVRRAGPSSP